MYLQEDKMKIPLGIQIQHRATNSHLLPWALQNSLAVCRKIDHKYHMIQRFHSIPKSVEYIPLPKDLYKNDYRNFTHNGPKLEKSKFPSTVDWINKTFKQSRQLHATMRMNIIKPWMKEAKHKTVFMHHMIPFIESTKQAKLIYVVRKQNNDYP